MTITEHSALFLDRDGVLNRLLRNDYVKCPDELEVLPGVKDALELFRKRFAHLFIVTNQQGIGKGLMTETDLAAVHRKLLDEIGRIDHIYHCPKLHSAHSFNRKPNIGMALQARHDYPDIRLKESVMAGDSASDMLFGRRAGMTTVLIGESNEIALMHPHLVDNYFPTLIDFADWL
jgi:histidinol-phosphate phosphatase family protein